MKKVYQKLLNFLKPKPPISIVILKGTPMVKYNILFDGLVTLTDCSITGAQDNAKILTAKLGGFCSSDLELVFSSRKMAFELIDYLLQHDIKFTRSDKDESYTT